MHEYRLQLTDTSSQLIQGGLLAPGSSESQDVQILYSYIPNLYGIGTVGDVRMKPIAVPVTGLKY